MKTFFSSNTSYSIALTVTPIRATLQDQSPDIPCNIPPMLETFSPSNIPITPATILANTQLLISSDIPPISKTFFTNIRPIFDLNDRLLNRESWKLVTFNIQQKQPTTHRYKIPIYMK